MKKYRFFNFGKSFLIACFVLLLVSCTETPEVSTDIYTITWIDVDHTILDTTEVTEGQMPSFELPNDTDAFDYTGWSPSIVPATENTTYTAVGQDKVFTITWQDADDTILGTTNVVYGILPEYELPEDTDRWKYLGWTPNIVEATEDTTYKAIKEDTKYTISNQVLVDTEELNITVVAAYDQIIFGFTVELYYENKTTDKELMFALGDSVINGYLVTSVWADSIKAGHTATETIYFSQSDLDELGIQWVDKIDMELRVYDANDWMAEYLVEENFIIYPTGLTEQDIVVPNRPTTDQEVILVDNEFVSIVIIDTYDDRIWGYTLQIYLENKTTDKELMFSLKDVIVNGYNINALWAKSIPANVKSVSEIHLSSTDMEASGILSVDLIDLYMRVYDNDNWFDDDIIEDKFTIYPTGLSPEEIISPARPTNVNEYIVIDNDEVTFVMIETDSDTIWGYGILVYIENKTNMELSFTWDDVLVNGIAIDPFWSNSILPGSKSVDTISFFKSDLEENEILNVNRIDFILRIYNSNDWLADDLVHNDYYLDI